MSKIEENLKIETKMRINSAVTTKIVVINCAIGEFSRTRAKLRTILCN